MRNNNFAPLNNMAHWKEQNLVVWSRHPRMWRPHMWTPGPFWIVSKLHRSKVYRQAHIRTLTWFNYWNNRLQCLCGRIKTALTGLANTSSVKVSGRWHVPTCWDRFHQFKQKHVDIKMCHQFLKEDLNCHPGMFRNKPTLKLPWTGNSCNTSVTNHTGTSFTSPWTEEVPALKSTPRCCLDKGFLVRGDKDWVVWLNDEEGEDENSDIQIQAFVLHRRPDREHSPDLKQTNVSSNPHLHVLKWSKAWL